MMMKSKRTTKTLQPTPPAPHLPVWAWPRCGGGPNLDPSVQGSLGVPTPALGPKSAKSLNGLGPASDLAGNELVCIDVGNVQLALAGNELRRRVRFSLPAWL